MKRHKLRVAVAAGVVMLLAIMAAATMVLLQRMEVNAQREAETRVRQMLNLAEHTVNREFLRVDSVLASMPGMFSSVAGPISDADGATMSRLLSGLSLQTSEFGNLILLRPDNTLWAAARPVRDLPPAPSTQEIPGSATITGPLRNRMNGSWVLFLSRPVVIPGLGRMRAAAEIPLPLLTSLLAPIATGSGQRILLERRSGELVASLPHDEQKIGKIQARPAARPIGGDIAAEAEQWVATRPTLYNDILVTVTLDRETALQDWRRDSRRLLVVVLVAAGLLLAFGFAIDAALRQRERTEEERRRAGEMLDNAIESMSDGFVMWDTADRLITCNQVYRDLYQVSSPLISRGAKFEDIIRGGVLLGQYPQAGTDVEEFVRRTVQWHRSNRGSVERLLPDGRWLLITERHTTWGGIVGIRTDITALKHASAELTAAHERVRQAMVEAQEHNMALIGRDHALHAQNVLFTAALDNMQHGLLMTDAAQRVIVCNARFLDLFGLSKAAAAPGTATAAVFHSIQLAGSLDGEFATQIEHDQTTLATTSRAGNFVTVDRQGRALRIAQRPMPDGGWIATYEDVTEQQQAEDRIRFMAHHDALTKLPNRVLLRSRLEEALHDRRSRGEELALLYLDLDRFKDVNDSLGHPVGDALLVAAAQRLRLCVRESDIVARLGGDEFAVLYRSPNLPGAALQLGERIIEALSATYDVAERTAVVGASVGVAIAAGPEQDVDSLLRKADLALYQAKAEGRGRCCLFEATMDVQFRARLALEADLRRAVAEQEFEVWYQPIWDLGQNRLCGFEALLRWDTGARGFVSPSTFVPVAEEMGLISDIGTWVLNQACTDAKTLPDHIRVAVNLSPLQLRDDGIVDIVAAALQRSGLAPDRLELEITESALLRDNASTGKLLAQLHGLGLRIALDDFGTGFSSLSHLRSFPFDKIKIDQSFVRDMAIRQDCAAIVESVAGLASKLGMITTAEGVETMAELALVREAGCTQAQGYIFGIPKPLRHAAADMIEEAPGRWALTT